jgi:protein-L-isoaspartate(D-aspartate) O-methyltransferase
MVADQLMKRGIQDAALLGAMGKIPRHLFVPEEEQDASYTDHPLAIGEGQTISQPYMVALMTQELGVRPGLKVLDVGTGSGYQAALLAELGAKVFSIERIPSLAESASTILKRLGYNQVILRVGDGSQGWPEESPFDLVIVTAAAASVPPPLLQQLKEDGRLVIPIGAGIQQILTVVEHRQGTWESREVCGCIFVPLITEDPS